MEEQRIRAIARVVEEGFEQHRSDPHAFADHLQGRGVALVEVVEALEDVDRVDGDESEGLKSLLRVALDLLRATDRVR